MDYEKFDVELEVGDLVLCYTDALVESRDADGQMLGPARLAAHSPNQSASSPARGSSSRCWTISADRFAGNLSEDDVTVMLLRPNAPSPANSIAAESGRSLQNDGRDRASIDPRAERPPSARFQPPQHRRGDDPPPLKTMAAGQSIKDQPAVPSIHPLI